MKENEKTMAQKKQEADVRDQEISNSQAQNLQLEDHMQNLKNENQKAMTLKLLEIARKENENKMARDENQSLEQ